MSERWTPKKLDVDNYASRTRAAAQMRKEREDQLEKFSKWKPTTIQDAPVRNKTNELKRSLRRQRQQKNKKPSLQDLQRAANMAASKDAIRSKL